MEKYYKLINEERKEYLSTERGKLGGHKGLKVYGKLDCPTAIKWIEKGYYVTNRVFFKDEYDAIMAGYRPCGSCQKEKYQEWKTDPEKYKQKIINEKFEEDQKDYN